MIRNRPYAAVVLMFVLLLSTGIALHFRSSVRGNLLAIYDLSRCRQTNLQLSPPVEARLVAHAGGAVRGLTYTNSRDALNENYARGLRVFELDFHWTTDGRLVLVHDWEQASSAFGARPHIFSYQEFTAATRRDGLHQLTFDDLRRWMRLHRDALVVTDTKADNGRLLDYLVKSGRDVCPQLIIQIYRLSELQAARQLGPRAVWFTVYKSNYPAWALSRITGVDAFVIPVTAYARYNQPPLMQRSRFYVHSVPADKAAETLKALPGIYGAYVD